MAVSKTPASRLRFTPDALLARLQAPQTPTPARLWVGFSGGLDSTVLLHALAARRDALPAPLHAVHVNHGLHADAAAWANTCASVCKSLSVPLESFGVRVERTPGASVEAAARDARYDVFRELLDTDDWLLTAQHQDDQLETFLLQALRGAGPHGLAAMPTKIRLGRGWLLRPMLEWPRAALEDWARAQDLRWLEDPSNADERFDRNYLRREVVPQLTARWPAAAATVSRSAKHCAEAALLVDELAATDLAAVARGEALDIAALKRLDTPRQRNLLRHWLDWHGHACPSEKKLEHVFSDVLDAAPDAEPCLRWADVAVRRYRGRLYAERELEAPRGGEWRGERFELGRGWGSLRRETGEGPGLPATARIDVRFREGGETLRPLGRRHHHELKKLFQEAGVLPWRRAVVPLIYADGELAAVADLWVNADVAETPGWHVRWQDAPRLRGDDAT